MSLIPLRSFNMSARHPIMPFSPPPGALVKGGVSIGKGAFLGAGCVIRQGLRIGEGALVAAGAIVVRDVLAGDQVGGVPAHPLSR